VASILRGRVTAEGARFTTNSLYVRDWFRRHREERAAGSTYPAAIPISDSNTIARIIFAIRK